MSEKSQSLKQSIPPDDPLRELAIPDEKSLHVGVVGNTYTILLTGKDTRGRFCLIDMHVPPGGGPPPHRHDFEESFTLLGGEIEITFRGVKSVLRAGETANIPANAPHQFQNKTTAGAPSLHLLTFRPGRILPGLGCACRGPDDASSQARRRFDGGFQGDFRGAR